MATVRSCSIILWPHTAAYWQSSIIWDDKVSMRIRLILSAFWVLSANRGHRHTSYSPLFFPINELGFWFAELQICEFNVQALVLQMITQISCLQVGPVFLWRRCLFFFSSQDLKGPQVPQFEYIWPTWSCINCSSRLASQYSLASFRQSCWQCRKCFNC